MHDVCAQRVSRTATRTEIVHGWPIRKGVCIDIIIIIVGTHVKQATTEKGKVGAHVFVCYTTDFVTGMYNFNSKGVWFHSLLSREKESSHFPPLVMISPKFITQHIFSHTYPLFTGDMFFYLCML